jgi:hypothetical protein
MVTPTVHVPHTTVPSYGDAKSDAPALLAIAATSGLARMRGQRCARPRCLRMHCPSTQGMASVATGADISGTTALSYAPNARLPRAGRGTASCS